MLATIFVQPYSKKKVTPHTLLPFPWDKPQPDSESNAAGKSTPERLKYILEQLDDNGK